MKYRGIIFVLDRTLLNSLADLADAANATLAKMAFPTHPEKAYCYYVGDGVRTLVERILPPEKRQDEAVLEQFLSMYVEEYGKRWDQKTVPYPGIPEMLDQLQEMGLKLGVFSNKPAVFTKKCVEKLLGHWHFDTVVGQCEEIPKKPDPTGCFHIQNEWGLKTEEIAYCGDTATDMLTARQAGFFSFGVTWGFRPEEELRASGACHIVRHPREILSVIQEA
ncbi:MAG: HAD family hydrolase [Planctomycetia bacterium]|nr:HAD family hydrolase [Planctomycetia bacterium]